MKKLFKIEEFRPHGYETMRLFGAVLNHLEDGLGNKVLGKNPYTSWVAQIKGKDPKYKFQRLFLKPKIDYSCSNSKGTRGIYKSYFLDYGGLYEAKYKTSWNCTTREFFEVNEFGKIHILDEDEVIEWLKNHLE